MKELEMSQAILYLKPKSEFTFQGTDYATIVWNKLDGDAPTLAQVNAAIVTLKNADAVKEEQAAAAKASAEAKLVALGLTTDDLKALGLGAN